MTFLKRIIVSLLVVCIFAGCIAQDIIISGDVVILESDYSGLGIVGVTANDHIELKSGFSFAASPGNTIFTSDNLVGQQSILPVTYQTLVDPVSRQIDTSLPFGSISGNQTVTSTGGFAYSIPIKVPPGTAGMEPKISISYNSQAGQGIVGFGWDISGLSAITRVNSTMFHDEVVDGISLSLDDKFALDGNRMVVTSGTSGADGSIYHTEIEDNSEIIAHGATGQGPVWFEVITPSGQTLQYGNTIDSRIEPEGHNIPYMWRINKITDSYGNYIEYQYLEQSGESAIRQISYTGFDGSSGPYNFVFFDYKEKADDNILYLAGYPIQQKLALDKIRIINEGKKVGEYELIYSFDFYSHLNEIVEYGSEGGRINSTIIGRGDATSIYLETFCTSIPDDSRLIPGDYNGDGRTDFFRVPLALHYPLGPTVGWNLYINQGDDTFLETDNGTFSDYVQDIDPEGFHWNWGGNYQNYDINGDGLDDVILGELIEYPYGSPERAEGIYFNQHYIMLISDGTTLTRDPEDDRNFNIMSPTEGPPKVIFGDFNGDGKMILPAPPPAIQGDYEFRAIWENDQLYEYEFSTIDFNGDGKADIMAIGENSSGEDNCIVFDANTTSELYNSTYPTLDHEVFTGDFNGDGKTDLLTYSNADGWDVAYSKGNGFQILQTDVPNLGLENPGDSEDDYNYYIQDYNGDGKDDICRLNLAPPYGTFRVVTVWYSVGNKFELVSTLMSDFYSINDDLITPGDFNGDGKADLFQKQTGNNGKFINFFKNEKVNLVHAISNGIGQNINVEYKTLTDNLVYTKGSGSNHPLLDIQKPLYVVSSIEVPTGVSGGTATTQYSYTGAKLHMEGRGFLGFTEIESKNSVFDYKKTITSYPNTTKNIMIPDYITMGTYNGTDISKQEHNFSISDVGTSGFRMQQTSSVQTDYVSNIETTTTYNTYDSFGNPTQITTEIGNDKTVIKNLTYDSFGGDIDNKVIEETISQTYGSEPSYSRTTEYDYNQQGSLTEKISDNGVTTTYTYFARGVLNTETIASSGLPTIFSLYNYDDKYRFVRVVLNPDNAFSLKEYDSSTGKITSETGYNGLTTLYEYDEFGRLKKTTSPLGNITNRYYQWYDSSTEPNGVYSVWDQIPGSSDQVSIFDLNGRVVRTTSDGFEGTVAVSSAYNNRGQLISKSEPYYITETNPDTRTFSYVDTYGRLSSESFQGNTTQYSYGSDYKTVTPQSGNSTTQYFNDAGDIIKVNDEGGNIDYEYHSSGQIKEIDYGSYTIGIEYDAFGYRESLNDPNAGLTTYDYNAYGQLVSYTDANNNTYTNSYDVMGRLLTITGAEGIVTNIYNTVTGSNYGLISSITGYNGISKFYSYNSYGQLNSLIETIEATNYTYLYTYDSFGKMASEEYPSGLKIQYDYHTTSGILEEISRFSDSKILWKRESESKPGMIESYSRGSGLNTTITFNGNDLPVNFETVAGSNTFQDYSLLYNVSTGNITQRKNNRYANLWEDFTYDDLNRLTSSTVYGGLTKSVTYVNNGNINSKTDIGEYSYDQTKLNAVTSIINNPGNINTDQDITYTAFNKTESISEGILDYTISYGPDQLRRVSTLEDQGGEIRKTIYGIGYDRIIENGVTNDYHYISAPTGVSSVIIKTGSTEDLYFTTTDQLGSITGLINETCSSLVEEFSYDPWGRKRNPTNWTTLNIPTSNFLLRGFTGHEHIEEFNLINMNGRCYDPLLGRFLSPDNFIQLPYHTQNYNRYSYCLNNPLSLTDPDGEWIITALFTIGSAYLNGVAANDFNPNPVKWDWKSMSTYSAIGFGAFSGYQLGTQIENFINIRSFSKEVGNMYQNEANYNVEFAGYDGGAGYPVRNHSEEILHASDITDLYNLSYEEFRHLNPGNKFEWRRGEFFNVNPPEQSRIPFGFPPVPNKTSNLFPDIIMGSVTNSPMAPHNLFVTPATGNINRAYYKMDLGIWEWQWATPYTTRRITLFQDYTRAKVGIYGRRKWRGTYPYASFTQSIGGHPVQEWVNFALSLFF